MLDRILAFLRNLLKQDEPKPIVRRQIGLIEVHKLIRDKFPEGDIHLSDISYDLCDISDIEKFLDIDETNHIKYVPEGFDCDNFARLLWGQLGKPGWASLAIGLFWTDTHAMVLCIDANLDVWLIEPQNDQRRSNLMDWQGTKMRFVVI